MAVYPKLINFCGLLLEGLYEINLDKRKLKTPAGTLFQVPNEALALAVATEWNAQESVIKRHTMYLVSASLCISFTDVEFLSWDTQFHSFILLFQCNLLQVYIATLHIDFHYLQTALCNTAIDNPSRRSQEDIVSGIIHFLETDTLW